MKLQSVNLGFGSKSKKSESEKSSNIFLCALGSATLGATVGAVARNYAPASDEFFHKISDSSDKKQELQDAVNHFIEEYSAIEIEDARILKTVLQSPEIQAEAPAIQGTGIKDLLQEETVKPITDADSVETRNAVKVIRTHFLEEIKDAKVKNSLPEKFESISHIANENLTKAKTAIFVRDNLIKYKNQLKGISDNGQKNISEIQSHMGQSTEGTPQMRKELAKAFNSMIIASKKSQRSIVLWSVLPGLALGALGMGISINRRLQKDFDKTKSSVAI